MNATRVLILTGIAAAFLPGISIAQGSASPIDVADAYGNDVTTYSEKMVCVRRSEWTPARAAESCDPATQMNQVHQAPVSAMMAAVPPPHAGSASGTSVKIRHDNEKPNKDPAQ